MSLPPRARPAADVLAWAAAWFTIAVWGSAFTGIAITLESFGPGSTALLRFGIASAVLAAVAMFRPPRLPALADVPRLAAVSAIGITTYHVLLNYGQEVVAPGTAALLIQTAPVFTTLLAARFGDERVHVGRWVGIGVATIGAAVIVFARGMDLEFSGRAISILCCAAATSVYFVFGRPLTRKYGSRTMTSWSIWLGTAPMLVFLPQLRVEAVTASSTSIAAAVYIGVIPAALAYLSWNFAVARLGASRVSALLYTAPLVAMAAQFAWYQTLPGATALVGGAVAVAGTALAARS